MSKYVFQLATSEAFNALIVITEAIPVSFPASAPAVRPNLRFLEALRNGQVTVKEPSKQCALYAFYISTERYAMLLGDFRLNT